MTSPEFKLFLDSAILLCAVLAVFNLARSRKRGASAYLMACALLAAGAALYLLHQDASLNLVYAAGGLVVLFLAADVVVRSKRSQL